MLWLSLVLQQLIPDFHDLELLFSLVHGFVGQDSGRARLGRSSLMDLATLRWLLLPRLWCLGALDLSYFPYSILSSRAFCMWVELLSGLRTVVTQGFRTPRLVQTAPGTRVSSSLKLPLGGSSHSPVWI